MSSIAQGTPAARPGCVLRVIRSVILSVIPWITGTVIYPVTDPITIRVNDSVSYPITIRITYSVIIPVIESIIQ